MEASVAVIAAAVVVAITRWLFLFQKRRQSSSDPYAIEPCPNPQCVRCRIYETVNQRAVRKLPWLNKDDRVVQGVKLGRRRHSSLERIDLSPACGQYPTVLLIPGLTARANVTTMHQRACESLQANFATILDEYQQHARNNMTIWTTNDTPSVAKWNVLHFLNQGQWIPETIELFPKTTAIVEKLPGLMEKCLFGNIFFSRIVPGTVIEPHCGPTNARHRLHLTLRNDDTMQQQFIGVRDIQLYWKMSETFVFDDSLRHFVDQCRAERVVLIVDLYHPELKNGERQTLRDLYPA